MMTDLPQPENDVNADRQTSRRQVLATIAATGVAASIPLAKTSAAEQPEGPSLTPDQAMAYLVSEIVGCKEALEQHLQLLTPGREELVISVGATPQALSSQNLTLEEGSSQSTQATELKELLHKPFAKDIGVKVKVEIHAGVYPLLDMQQVSTNARWKSSGPEKEIAISVLAEVCSPVFVDPDNIQLHL